MPVIQIHLLEGQTREAKQELVRRVTEVVCDTLNKPSEKVRIILDEKSTDSYAIGGVLVSDMEKG